MQEPVFEEKIEEPVFMHAYEEYGVLYCASSTSKGVYWYTYVMNNPLLYTDPSGYNTKSYVDEIVWNLGMRGLDTWTDEYGYHNPIDPPHMQMDRGTGGGGNGGSGVGGYWQTTNTYGFIGGLGHFDWGG